jgi:hypothetical protein
MTEPVYYPFSYCGSVVIRYPQIKKAIRIQIDPGAMFLLQRVNVDGCPDAIVKLQFDSGSIYKTKACHLGPMTPEINIQEKLVIAFKVPHTPWWKFWQRRTTLNYILSGQKIYRSKPK